MTKSKFPWSLAIALMFISIIAFQSKPKAENNLSSLAGDTTLVITEHLLAADTSWQTNDTVSVALE